jgi:UDP-N-acetylglucosamine 2-epimerase (non-hydrolysing)/GDP/UDP-N,N'-diacetylbacillosamine 2-epimerase (hydrolysing)
MRHEGANVCFVTGTRAEFGLMRQVLLEIKKQARLKLQLIATGMHLDPSHGDGLKSIQQDGWTVDRVVPWDSNSGRDRRTTARLTGLATAALADAFAELGTDIVLVVGDRVEAFAAASAAHLSGIAVAHVHGGDRAAGQADDCLRHAISKLSHLHFPATKESAGRLKKLGEHPWRIHRAGSPGLDGIVSEAASAESVREALGDVHARQFALLILHPVDADAAVEAHRACLVLRAAQGVPYERIVIVYPNNDPGAAGIIGCWDELSDPRFISKRDVPRPIFLGLLRDAAVLLGNSSSGIIEAASFGTPVVDVGPRQQGREHGRNVIHLPYNQTLIRTELRRLWNNGSPRRFKSDNIYGGSGAGRKIASTLASLPFNARLFRKLIAY